MEKRAFLKKGILVFFAGIMLVLSVCAVGESADSFSTDKIIRSEYSLHNPQRGIESQTVISKGRMFSCTEFVSVQKGKHIQFRYVNSHREIAPFLITGIVFVILLLLERREKSDFSRELSLSIIIYIHNKDGSKPVLA